jgi:uncharacterized protein YjlB
MDIQPAHNIPIEQQSLSPAEGFPNNAKLPLVIYKQALSHPHANAAGDLQRLFESNAWGGGWKNGVFACHHFHSNTHEVLGVCSGNARIQFGGPSGPILEVQAGDVAVVPAGTAHKRIEASADFLVVGAYPAGHENYDLLRGEPAEEESATERIAKVPLPATDPLYGAGGPLFSHWTR